MIEITNSRHLSHLLKQLDKDKIAVFGKMTSQHMVEHLQMVLSTSNGKFPQECRLPQEISHGYKMKFVYTDAELPAGVKFPGSKDALPDLRNENLEIAIEKLFDELGVFHQYFKDHPESTPIHTFLGALNYREWIIFHGKHFSHHFKQFELI